MVAYGIVWSKAVKLWTRGVYICIELPMKTLHVLWGTQLFLIFLPFRCANRIFRLIVPNVPKHSKKKILNTIMCCDLDEDNKVLNAFHDIQTSSLCAINKINCFDIKRRHGQDSNGETTTFESFPSETSSICNEEKSHIEEMELLTPEPTKVALSNEMNGVSENDLCASLPNISANEFGCRHDCLIATSIHKFFQSYVDGLRKQAEEIHNMKIKCPDVVSHTNVEKSILEIFNDSLFKFPVDSISSLKISGGIDKLQAITHLLNVENSQLKEHLKLTNDQLNDTRTATLCLSQRVFNLELQLNQFKDILRNVSTDRDTMQEKLRILQQMIEEEEIYLNDDNSRDESYNELYVTAQNFNLHGLETSSPLENQNICFTVSDKEQEYNSQTSV